MDDEYLAWVDEAIRDAEYEHKPAAAALAVPQVLVQIARQLKRIADTMEAKPVTLAELLAKPPGTAGAPDA